MRFAALDAEFFAFLTPDFVEVFGIGVIVENACLNAVQEEVHAGGFKAALGFIVGVVGGGAFLFVEDREVFERAVEDFDFARGCDVTNATGLLWSDCRNCFSDRHGVF